MSLGSQKSCLSAFSGDPFDSSINAFACLPAATGNNKIAQGVALFIPHISAERFRVSGRFPGTRRGATVERHDVVTPRSGVFQLSLRDTRSFGRFRPGHECPGYRHTVATRPTIRSIRRGATIDDSSGHLHGMNSVIPGIRAPARGGSGSESAARGSRFGLFSIFCLQCACTPL